MKFEAKYHACSHYRGFTLLELLMVVALIAFLTSLSVSVMYGITDQANEEATNATIRKLNGLLEKRLEGFNKAIGRNGDFKDRYVNAARNLLRQDEIFGPLVANRQNGESDDAVVEALARKVAMRHMFPQRHEDLLLLSFLGNGTTSVTDFLADGTLKAIPANPSSIDRDSERSADVSGNRIADVVERVAADPSMLPTADAWVNDETVSSELLYFFLVHSASLGASDAATDQFTTAEIADTDQDGLLEFVDAWGNPLRFYRWPTRMIDVDAPSPYAPVLTNTSDPTDVAPVGPRIISTDERLVANILFKGLPPVPTSIPTADVDLNDDGDTADAGESGNTVLPRDLLFIDPDDPVGVLYRALEEYDGTNGTAFAAEFNETNYHTPDTFHAPLIVSAGGDELLGMFEPSDTANLGNLAAYDLTVSFSEVLERISDNLTNRNRRSGGR